jgi:CDP-diacylglycerol pyrophosphatase
MLLTLSKVTRASALVGSASLISVPFRASMISAAKFCHPAAMACGTNLLMLSNRVLVSLLILAGAAGGVAAAERDLLWGVVKVCVANHQLTGGAFPCLEVNTGEGLARGFAVVRAPLKQTHVVVTPTARVAGIEDAGLQSAEAPNYFADAWGARKYVLDSVERPISETEIGLAVNSRPGRSQDQLHIHVDCLRHRYAQLVRQHDAGLSAEKWTRLTFALRGRYYWAMLINSPDLSHTNIFRTAATLLRVSPGRMEDVTVVMIPRPDRGFYLLADQYAPGAMGKGHGEFLLDHACGG